jgi:hypothetical protein
MATADGLPALAALDREGPAGFERQRPGRLDDAIDIARPTGQHHVEVDRDDAVRERHRLRPCSRHEIVSGLAGPKLGRVVMELGHRGHARIDLPELGDVRAGEAG